MLEVIADEMKIAGSLRSIAIPIMDLAVQCVIIKTCVMMKEGNKCLK